MVVNIIWVKNIPEKKPNKLNFAIINLDDVIVIKAVVA